MQVIKFKLQHVDDKKGNNKITHVGEQMALFPLPPRFSKMLMLGLQQDDLIAYTISLVASLSVQSLFLGEISKNLNILKAMRCDFYVLLGHIAMQLKIVIQTIKSKQ